MIVEHDAALRGQLRNRPKAAVKRAIAIKPDKRKVSGRPAHNNQLAIAVDLQAPRLIVPKVDLCTAARTKTRIQTAIDVIAPNQKILILRARDKNLAVALNQNLGCRAESGLPVKALPPLPNVLSRLPSALNRRSRYSVS